MTDRDLRPSPRTTIQRRTMLQEIHNHGDRAHRREVQPQEPAVALCDATTRQDADDHHDGHDR